jgi:hypothetical protein
VIPWLAHWPTMHGPSQQLGQQSSEFWVTTPVSMVRCCLTSVNDEFAIPNMS